MFVHWLLQVFSYPSPSTILLIAAKTFVIYLFVIVGMRLLGTREMGSMTIYDFVLIVVISNAVQNALVGGDTTLVGGLDSALVLLLTNWGLTELSSRYDFFEHALIGEPAVIVNNGRIQWDRMRREGIDREELMAGLREHGVLDIDDVRLAVLEVDGTISVVPAGSTVHRSRRPIRVTGTA